MCCIYCIYNGVGDINVGFTTRSMDFTLVARELWEEGKSPLYETAFVYYKSLLKWVTALMIMVSTICQENHVTSKQRMLMKQSCGHKKGACFMHLKQICWFWDNAKRAVLIQNSRPRQHMIMSVVNVFTSMRQPLLCLGPLAGLEGTELRKQFGYMRENDLIWKSLLVVWRNAKQNHLSSGGWIHVISPKSHQPVCFPYE